MAQIDSAEIEKRFTHHVPGPIRTEQHTAIRAWYRDFATEVNDLMPESREKSLAMTALEESSFWAHASIARNVKEQDGT